MWQLVFNEPAQIDDRRRPFKGHHIRYQSPIPGRIITGWFEATLTGTYDIQCAEICGIGHGLMPGRIVIESAADHAAWMAGRVPTHLAAASGGTKLAAASHDALSAN